MSIYNKKITIQNHPLTYEQKISINKGCRDGIYAGHGAGNMQIENLINKSTDTKNTDTKTINDMTAGMRVSDYIKTDSSDNMSKKAAVVGSSNSVDMSDTIYARPQAKNEAGNNDGTDMAENLLNDMNQTSENRRNDMIVTASTTTSDDYKAAKDDGYDVIVTETDKIKAVLAKAGVDISIYGDDLSREQLTDITGSQTEAAMLVNQMKAYDIPATDDNIKAGTDAIDRAKSLTNISNETKAYLVRNNMNPTVSNVYKATYSSSQVQDYRQKTKMTEISDELFEELKPQLKQILEEAHIDSSDENLNQCRWLIDEDIAVTPDNVLLANRVDCINAAEENVSSDFYARAVTEALAMGKKATDATMSQDGLIFDMAKKACDVLGEATADDIVTLESDNMPVTIENLSKLIAARDKDGAASQASANKALDNQITDSREARLVTAQRKLEEAMFSCFTASGPFSRKHIITKSIRSCSQTQPLSSWACSGWYICRCCPASSPWPTSPTATAAGARRTPRSLRPSASVPGMRSTHSAWTSCAGCSLKGCKKEDAPCRTKR